VDCNRALSDFTTTARTWFDCDSLIAAYTIGLLVTIDDQVFSLTIITTRIVYNKEFYSHRQKSPESTCYQYSNDKGIAN